jgi:hypothetical protein
VVASASEQERLGADDLLGSCQIVAPGDLLDVFQATREVPTLVVQLGPDTAAYAWLREICVRAILPFVSLAPDSFGDGAAANLGDHATPGLRALRARQPLHVLEAAYSHTFVETEKAALTAFWPFTQDSGWEWLWRLVKLRIAA